MNFVREKISEADIVTYRLRGINDDLLAVGFGNGWVIDRTRNIYLRWIRCDRENPSRMLFTFFWRDVILELEMISSSADDAEFEHNTTWALAHQTLDLPSTLEAQREEILQDLRNAITAYGSFGMSYSSTRHDATILF